jgi:hypothetical protein
VFHLSTPDDKGQTNQRPADSAVNAEYADKDKRKAKITLIVVSVGLALLSPALLVALVMSVAAPGGSLFSAAIPAIGTALPYLTVAVAWSFYIKRNYSRALLCARAPIVVFILLFVFSSALTFFGSMLGFPTLTTKTYHH